MAVMIELENYEIEYICDALSEYKQNFMPIHEFFDEEGTENEIVIETINEMINKLRTEQRRMREKNNEGK